MHAKRVNRSKSPENNNSCHVNEMYSLKSLLKQQFESSNLQIQFACPKQKRTMKARKKEPTLLQLCEIYQRQTVSKDGKCKDATTSGRTKPANQMVSTAGQEGVLVSPKKCTPNSDSETDSRLCRHNLYPVSKSSSRLVKIQAPDKANNSYASDSGVIAPQPFHQSLLAKHKFAFPAMAEVQETAEVGSGYKAGPTGIDSPAPSQSFVFGCQQFLFPSSSELHSPSTEINSVLRSSNYHFPTAAKNNFDHHSLTPLAKARPRIVKIQAPNKFNNGYASDSGMIALPSSSPSPLAKCKYAFPAMAKAQETTEVRNGYKADPTGIAGQAPSQSSVSNCQEFLSPPCSEVLLPSTEANSVLQSESHHFSRRAANNYVRERQPNLKKLLLS